jgi:hypothetical protein
MAKKTSIYLLKMKGNEAKDCPIVFVPKFQADIDKAAKIKGESEAMFWQYRNLKFHRKLFGIAGNIVNDEFFEMMFDMWNDIKTTFNIKLNITKEAIQAIRLENNDDCYSLIYICKSIFLPWEKKWMPNGIIIFQVSSISFRAMDNIEFEEFYNKCICLWAYILNCPVNELDLNYD